MEHPLVLRRAMSLISMLAVIQWRTWSDWLRGMRWRKAEWSVRKCLKYLRGRHHWLVQCVRLHKFAFKDSKYIIVYIHYSCTQSVHRKYYNCNHMQSYILNILTECDIMQHIISITYIEPLYNYNPDTFGMQIVRCPHFKGCKAHNHGNLGRKGV